MANKFGGINDMRGRCYSTQLSKNIYDTWYSMLYRVHSLNSLSSRPSYTGCTIEPSWYILSNFVNDFKQLPGYSDYEKSNGIGYSLDKDILVSNNKHYGPSTCCIVPIKVNSSESINRNTLIKSSSVRRTASIRSSLSRDYNDIHSKKKETLSYTVLICVDYKFYSFGCRVDCAEFLSYYLDGDMSIKSIRKWKTRLWRIVDKGKLNYNIMYYKEVV